MMMWISLLFVLLQIGKFNASDHTTGETHTTQEAYTSPEADTTPQSGSDIVDICGTTWTGSGTNFKEFVAVRDIYIFKACESTCDTVLNLFDSNDIFFDRNDNHNGECLSGGNDDASYIRSSSMTIGEKYSIQIGGYAVLSSCDHWKITVECLDLSADPTRYDEYKLLLVNEAWTGYYNHSHTLSQRAACIEYCTKSDACWGIVMAEDSCYLYVGNPSGHSLIPMQNAYVYRKNVCSDYSNEFDSVRNPGFTDACYDYHYSTRVMRRPDCSQLAPHWRTNCPQVCGLCSKGKDEKTFLNRDCEGTWGPCREDCTREFIGQPRFGDGVRCPEEPTCSAGEDKCMECTIPSYKEGYIISNSSSLENCLPGSCSDNVSLTGVTCDTDNGYGGQVKPIGCTASNLELELSGCEKNVDCEISWKSSCDKDCNREYDIIQERKGDGRLCWWDSNPGCEPGQGLCPSEASCNYWSQCTFNPVFRARLAVSEVCVDASNLNREPFCGHKGHCSHCRLDERVGCICGEGIPGPLTCAQRCERCESDECKRNFAPNKSYLADCSAACPDDSLFECQQDVEHECKDGTKLTRVLAENCVRHACPTTKAVEFEYVDAYATEERINFYKGSIQKDIADLLAIHKDNVVASMKASVRRHLEGGITIEIIAKAEDADEAAEVSNKIQSESFLSDLQNIMRHVNGFAEHSDRKFVTSISMPTISNIIEPTTDAPESTEDTSESTEDASETTNKPDDGTTTTKEPEEKSSNTTTIVIVVVIVVLLSLVGGVYFWCTLDNNDKPSFDDKIELVDEDGKTGGAKIL